MKEDTTSGVLNINKPRGRTSHDVVERVRALTKVRRVGHAGTLDPLATGVLVVCVGRTATRAVEYLMEESKIYRTEARLGIVTDTFDAAGEILARSPVEVGRDELRRTLIQFRGVIEQVPPMYSAVKHNGKPLYRLARRGIEVEREPRLVEIRRLELIAWEPAGRQARCTLEIECSPGTYVRALVHDLGQELGCGAHVTGLTRLSSGSFRLEDAVTLGRLAQAVRDGHWPELLCPIDEALAGRFSAMQLDAHEAQSLCSGQPICARAGTTSHTALTRVYGPEGRFLALAAFDPQDEVWRPKKVFISPYRYTCPDDHD